MIMNLLEEVAVELHLGIGANSTIEEYKSEGFQNTFNLFVQYSDTGQGSGPLSPNKCISGQDRIRIEIQRVHCCSSTCDFADQRNAAFLCTNNAFGVNAPFEPGRGLATKTQTS